MLTNFSELVNRNLYPENSRARNLKLYEDELFFGSKLKGSQRAEFLAGALSPYTTPNPLYVLGCDDSHWGRWLDFTNTKQAGVEFWFQKAIDGTLRNAYFELNYRNAHAKGLIVAPYGWLYPDSKISCKAQARAYWDFLVEIGIETQIPPVIDFEWTSWMGSPANPNWNDLDIWVTEFIRLSGIKPILYTAKGYADQFGQMPMVLRAKFSAFWFANYGVSKPNLPLGFTHWDFWQFTASLEQAKYAPSSVDKKELDGNYWWSTLQALRDFAGVSGNVPPVDPPPVDPDPTDIFYVGKVKSSATPYVILRDAPAGSDIAHLFPDTPIEGKGQLLYANGYNRMELTAPQAGWIASEFLDYQIVGTPPPVVPDDVLTHPYVGVDYHQITRYGYRTFVLVIDMDTKKRAHVTNTNGKLVTVGSIANSTNAQIAINGDAWDNVSPYMPQSIAVSDGVYYSNKNTGVPFLNISSGNALSIRTTDYNGLHNAVAGFRHLIENGLKKDYLYGSEIKYTERHPRSAKGITKDGKLILIGCEGRNEVGLGITLSELADIFLEFNTEEAFDNDSGGSFALTIGGVLQNLPSNPNNAERPVVNHLLIFIEEDTGGQLPVGDLKLTTAEAGKSRNVRRDPPVGKAHIFGNTFAFIPNDGYGIANDTYEYTENVYNNGSLVAKAGDIWYVVSHIGVDAIEGSAWTAGIHLGVPQVNVEVISVDPPPDPPVNDLPNSVWLSTELNGVRTEYKKVV